MQKIIGILIFFFITFSHAVTGGLEVNPTCPDCKYPFNVSIQTWDWDVLTQQIPLSSTLWDGHYCQGALVAPDWVLTTADCARGKLYNPWGDAAIDFLQDLLTDNYDPDASNDIQLDQMWVEIGLHAIVDTEGKDSIGVVNRYIHPNYDHFAGDYNYALLQLSQPSTFEPIALIQDESLDSPGQSPIVMGWGGRSGGNATAGLGLPSFSFDASDVLFENNTLIEECVASDSIAIGDWFEASIDFDRTLCTQKLNYTGMNCDPCGFGSWWEPNAPGGACFGDEGAPFITTNADGNYELVGNFIIGCTSIDNTAIPGLYSRIFPVKDWIYSYIGYPCNEGAFVNISIVFDEYPNDISWELWYKGQTPNEGYQYLVKNGNGSDEMICISEEGVYEFIIYDENGDGLCCTSYPFGSYEVALDTGGWSTPNEEIIIQGGTFGFSESTLFTWPSSNGDINSDGSLNVIDIVTIIEHILNEGEYILNVDINIDGFIDIIDVVIFVDLILNN